MQLNRKHKYKSLRQQQGVVIVVALFIVALAVTMAYYMMARLYRDTHRTQLVLRDTQAELYAQGSIIWAMEQLQTNLVKRKPKKPVDVMPIKSPKNTVYGYTISSEITDMQARFNINNLTTDEAKVDFKHLLSLVLIQLDEKKRNDLTLAIVDWITPGQVQNSYNQFYMSLPTPYRAAHRAMVSITELKLVKGMTPALFAVLQPFVTALPKPTLVNVQTASAEVMAALSPQMTLEAGKAIEKERAHKTIEDPAAFKNLDVVKNHNISATKITTVSNYFLVETTVTIEEQQLVIYTLLERAGSDSQGGINIIWQSKSVPA